MGVNHVVLYFVTLPAQYQPSSSNLLLSGLVTFVIFSIEVVPFVSVSARLENGPTFKTLPSGVDHLRDGAEGGVICFSRRGGDSSGDGSMYARPLEG
ncbi:hypothetical protein BDR04DRAFT_1093049 [Suillus decipiens]|nr:hypothetical protein BDR04DRAFT_1093049 [Suillus decipiens]